jgi:lipoyl(octanoyl) transferase
VTALEVAVIRYVAGLGIDAATRSGAPGVYVGAAKLASVGIRVRRGASYHGLALNVNMDLGPFGRINPCGYEGLAMTQLALLGKPRSVREAAEGFAPVLLGALAEKRHVEA